jgi:hypothetical protein
MEKQKLINTELKKHESQKRTPEENYKLNSFMYKGTMTKFHKYNLFSNFSLTSSKRLFIMNEVRW